MRSRNSHQAGKGGPPLQGTRTQAISHRSGFVTARRNLRIRERRPLSVIQTRTNPTFQLALGPGSES